MKEKEPKTLIQFDFVWVIINSLTINAMSTFAILMR